MHGEWSRYHVCMNKDEHLQRHLDHCQKEQARLVAEGKWPWPDDSQEFQNLVESEYCAYPLSDETLRALEQLGLVLKAVYLRLRKEGYQLKDGKIIKSDE